MADKTEIISPVTIDSDSKERVAFDLMNKIDYYSTVDADQKNEQYWLKLYRKCYKATKGLPLERILQED